MGSTCPSEKKCAIGNTYCEVHGFIHGGEAEELREGVERLLEEYERRCGEAGGKDECANLCQRLRELMDKVDARDSLAYLEAKGT